MKKGWLLWDEHKIGTYFQCKAIETSLSSIALFEEKPIKLSWWAQVLPWPIGFSPPFPDFIIAGGRQAIHIAWCLRKKTKTIILQNPRSNLSAFSLVIAAEHDGLPSAPNLITTVGNLSTVRPFEGDIPWNVPQPWCGVLIGGNSRHHVYTQEDANILAQHLRNLPIYSFIITPSRRTPLGWCDYLRAQLKDRSIWIWNGEGANPYSAILTASNILVVTNDSVSMLSEACSTGHPVYIARMKLKTPRIEKFSQILVERGYATCLGENYPFIPIAYLNERERISPFILKLLHSV